MALVGRGASSAWAVTLSVAWISADVWDITRIEETVLGEQTPQALITLDSDKINAEVQDGWVERREDRLKSEGIQRLR